MSAAVFEVQFEKALLKLRDELVSKTYQPGPHTCFVITDPKPREVWAADFRDRIIHHLLVAYLEPIFEPKFIFHSYACRCEKGAHKAIRYLQIANRKSLIANRSLYYLQTDIYSFFVSIDKQILFNILKRYCHNTDILWLVEKIIFQNPTDNFIIHGDKTLFQKIPPHKSLFCAPAGKGLPIGNLTSQFFANVYLNELDQFVKHTLKCRYYFRYMDDLLLLHSSPNQLVIWKNEIDQFVKNNLALKLHPKKQIIQPVKNGINFLGYITKPNYSLSRKRVVSALKRKLHRLNLTLNPQAKYQPEKPILQTSLPLIFPKEIPALAFLQKAQATVNSYFGHFQHCHSLKLRKSLYFCYFKELKKYLIPADNNFYSFIIEPHLKNYYQTLKKDS
ncbi:reverse transcriptase/maturase family protein [Patescibacteria group bacterium]|nr:reverse transcriptase/maturase family protein [Patescibacteria group bacterium]MCG2690105.1 reverse transcriptase/maturase family protein [Candidatus Parcubacteria bacterium]